MNKLNLTKIAGGAGIIVLLTKYFRRVVDVIALTLLVYAVTSLLSPYSNIAEYLKENISIIVIGIVSATFLMASLIGKKKINGRMLLSNDDPVILFVAIMVMFTVWMVLLSRVPTPCVEGSLGQISIDNNTTKKVRVVNIKDNTAVYNVSYPANEGQQGIKETNIKNITCYK